MSQLESSNAKIRLLEEEFMTHNRAAHTLIQIFEAYRAIERRRAEQIGQLLPVLDAVKAVHYKDLADKLGNYLDTCMYQINHMIEDFDDVIGDYSNFRALMEARFTTLFKDFKAKRSDTLNSLMEMALPVNRDASQPPKPFIARYNSCHVQYQHANKELLTFRKEYQPRMMSEAEDHLTRFFVLELERLRNNQFDIDQILKKKSTDEYKMAPVQHQILWEVVEGGPLSQRILTEYDMDKINELVPVLLKERLLLTHEIFQLFDPACVNSNLAKLPDLLSDSEYEQALKTVLFYFRQQRFLVQDNTFKKVYLLIKPILQHAVKEMKSELLQSVVAFSSAICTQKIISVEKEIQLCEVVCLLDYTRHLECCSEGTWGGIYENLLRVEGENQREALLEKYRRCVRRLGLPSLDHRLKKRIFNKTMSLS